MKVQVDTITKGYKIFHSLILRILTSHSKSNLSLRWRFFHSKTLFSLLPFLAFVPYFTPPTHWECIKPKEISPYVQIGFIGKGSSEFRPSINFATEEVDVPLKEYVKAVKKIHTQESKTSWRDLGKFKMQAGEGRLTEITTSSPWGKVKILQALFVNEGTAYIITGASLAQEFVKVQSEFLNTFRSFSLLPNLFSLLSEETKSKFEKIFSDSNNTREIRWENFQQAASNCSEMGNFWHFLALKEGYSKIFQKEEDKNNPGKAE